MQVRVCVCLSIVYISSVCHSEQAVTHGHTACSAAVNSEKDVSGSINSHYCTLLSWTCCFVLLLCCYIHCCCYVRVRNRSQELWLWKNNGTSTFNQCQWCLCTAKIKTCCIQWHDIAFHSVYTIYSFFGFLSSSSLLTNNCCQFSLS